MNVLIPQGVYEEIASAARQREIDVMWLPYSEGDGPVDGLENADAVLRWVAGKRFSALVEQGPQVSWLHTASAGVDHVLTPAVRAKSGLRVTDSGPAFEIAISEFVLAWMLMTARRLPALIDHQRAGSWQPVMQQELYGKTVGVIGLGPIGQGIAARAKAFGMKTIGLRRRPLPVSSVDDVVTGGDGLQHLLQSSDYVVLAAALTDGTRALIRSHELMQMKPTAWLINIARGGIVDESALINVLQRNRIAGACLDVFAQEPLPADSPLWKMPNVYIAPHDSSGGTAGLRERQKQLFLDNLARFSRGEPLENVVDQAEGY